jgi:hypothetical protein
MRLVRWNPYIPAGGQGEIVVQLEPNRLNGKFERTLTVVSNDPKSPETFIHFYGHAPEFPYTHSGDHI